MNNDKALIIVDVQNDFCPGGSLPVPDGDKIIEPLNKVIKLAEDKNLQIYFSQDYHPLDTQHFRNWPMHCVQGTLGANFHKDLYIPHPTRYRIVWKGMGDSDDYSIFDVGLQIDSKQLLIAGLATDYCVLWTVKGAIERGYKVILMEDACRAVNLNPGDGEKAISEMRKLGAEISTTERVINELLKQ